MSGNVTCFLASFFPSLCITISEYGKYSGRLLITLKSSPVHLHLSRGHSAISPSGIGCILEHPEVLSAKHEKFLGGGGERGEEGEKSPFGVKHEWGQKEKHFIAKNGTLATNLMESVGIKCHQLYRADLRCYHSSMHIRKATGMTQ